MNETRLGRSSWILWIGLLAGCGGGASPVPFDAYCDRYTEMACSVASRCGCLEGVPVDVCKSYLRPDCVDGIETPVAAGLAVYDPAKAGSCLAGMRAVVADCSTDGDEFPTACETFLAGALAEGEACPDYEWCRPGLECDGQVCIDPPGPGESCQDNYICAQDLFCGGDEICHAYLGAGAACTQEDVCDDDLYCSEAQGTCRPYPGRGGDCADSWGACADGYYCDPDSTCQAQLTGGADCDQDEQCPSYDCQDGTCVEEEPDDICDDW